VEARNARSLCGKIFSLLGTNFTMNVVLVRRVRLKVSPVIQTSISFNLNARKSRLKSCYNDRLVPERGSYIEMTRITLPRKRGKRRSSHGSEQDGGHVDSKRGSKLVN